MANLYGKDIKYNNSVLLDSSQAVQKTSDKPQVLDTTTTTESFSMKFESKSGDARNFNYASPKEDITDDDIKNASAVMLEKGSIFEDPLIALVSATATTTTKRKFDL